MVGTYKQQCTADGKYLIVVPGGNNIVLESNELIDDCIEYNSEKKCIQCAPGYQLISNKCYICPDQYMQSIGDGINCYLPILNCIDYDNSGKCVGCNQNYILENDECKDIPTKEPARNNSYRINLNIILIMITFGILL